MTGRELHGGAILMATVSALLKCIQSPSCAFLLQRSKPRLYCSVKVTSEIFNRDLVMPKLIT